MPYTLCLSAALVFLGADSTHAGTRPLDLTARDTIDVAVGSPVVDFSGHKPGSTRALQEMTVDGSRRQSRPPLIWTFTFENAGTQPLLIVRGAPEKPAPGLPAMPIFVFDRRTLALREMRNPETNQPTITVDGTHVKGEAMTPNGPMPVDAHLATPGFFAPLADLLVESLPRKLGAVYRVPQWGPPGMRIETHLYSMVRREDITVLGKQYRNAWVVEDRNADGSRLLGMLWLVDRSPHLVRWVINQPNGAVIRLDQEAVAAHP